jgi:hypothetical protein
MRESGRSVIHITLPLLAACFTVLASVQITFLLGPQRVYHVAYCIVIATLLLLRVFEEISPKVPSKPLTLDLMETLDHFLQDLKLLWVNSVPKMNRIDFANRKLVYNFHSINFSVGSVLIIASPPEKKSEVFMRFKVRSFDGTLSDYNLKQFTKLLGTLCVPVNLFTDYR